MTARFFNAWDLPADERPMECPKCGDSVPKDAPQEEVLKKFYPRHAGRGYWVCYNCKRAFHESGIRVS